MTDNTPTRRFCVMHNDYDTNGDGKCRTYGTARPEFDLLPCLLVEVEHE